MGYFYSKESQFHIDSCQERIVGSYLDKFLYTKDLFSFVQRIEDKDTQRSGVDIILTSQSLGLANAKVDEKCALSFINCDIPTFAFELSSKKIGPDNKPVEPFQRKEGWLLNNNLNTEYYLLTWLFACPIEKKEHFPSLQEQDIISSLFVLIKKNSIVNILSQKGYTSDKLRETDAYLRSIALSNGDSACCDAARKISKSGDVKFSYTFSRAERPINVLLYRSEMIAYAQAFGVVSRGLTTIVSKNGNHYVPKEYYHGLP